MRKHRAPNGRVCPTSSSPSLSSPSPPQSPAGKQSTSSPQLPQCSPYEPPRKSRTETLPQSETEDSISCGAAPRTRLGAIPAEIGDGFAPLSVHRETPSVDQRSSSYPKSVRQPWTDTGAAR